MPFLAALPSTASARRVSPTGDRPMSERPRARPIVLPLGTPETSKVGRPNVFRALYSTSGREIRSGHIGARARRSRQFAHAGAVEIEPNLFRDIVAIALGYLRRAGRPFR